MKPYRILFVCMGNICRSPTAHGVMQSKLERLGWESWLHVDSAGTHNFHPDSPPDERSQKHAALRGYDLSALRARQVVDADFSTHDLILAMDSANLAQLRGRCPSEFQGKLRRVTEFCRNLESQDVPDPYYGGSEGFELVLDLVEDACEGLLMQASTRPEGGGS
jgi:protein-tyrosine phosphatase